MNNSRLTIQSQTENLRLVREFISKNARDFGFDEESVDKISLAVDEACTNIIKHSYEYASNKDIEIVVMTRPGQFEIIISDRGKSFDPSMVKIPDMKEYIRKLKNCN